MVCCFFGHGDAPESVCPELERVIRELIASDVATFLVGNHGNFDRWTLTVLRRLKREFPDITYQVVLSVLPGRSSAEYAAEETLCPEGLEQVFPRYAISFCNRWMAEQADVVVTWITHSWGGAAQYAELAKRKKKRIINLPDLFEKR